LFPGSFFTWREPNEGRRVFEDFDVIIARLGGDSKERGASCALKFGCELAAVIGSSENEGVTRVSQTGRLRPEKRRKAAITAAPMDEVVVAVAIALLHLTAFAAFHNAYDVA
jgi:hypothetical protein